MSWARPKTGRALDRASKKVYKGGSPGGVRLPMSKKRKAKVRLQSDAPWRTLLALGIVAVVAALIAAGLWAMSPRSIPAAVAEATPTAMATATRHPTYTATPSPSPTLPPATPSPTPQPTVRQEPFTLTLLHTNDTWGYTRPCG